MLYTITYLDLKLIHIFYQNHHRQLMKPDIELKKCVCVGGGGVKHVRREMKDEKKKKKKKKRRELKSRSF